MHEFQLRSEETGLSYTSSLADALVRAKADKTIWKISFFIGNERVILERNLDDEFELRG